MRGTAVVGAVVIACGTAQAGGYYQCVVNGQNVFSDRPCAPSAERKELHVVAPSASEAASAQARVKQAEADQAQLAVETRRRSIQAEIANLEGEISADQDRMERELAALRERKGYAMNNLAGATLEGSIAAEMSAVTAKYTTQIGVAQTRIKTLRDELARLLP